MKLGIIGSGKIVQMILEARIQDVVDVPLIYCRNAEKGKQLQEKYGIPVTQDYPSFLNSQEIDTIYIGLPNSLHYSFGKEALLANKHVIQEKPFTSTLKEAKELVSLAKEKSLFLFESILPRYSPNLVDLKEALQRIGKIKKVHLDYQQLSSRYEAYLRHEVLPAFDPKLDGGSLMDINIYNLHFAIQLFGKPSEVRYEPELGWNGVDIRGTLFLSYPEFEVECVGSKANGSKVYQEIEGENGKIYIEQRPADLRNIQIMMDHQVNLVGAVETNIYQNEFKQMKDVLDRGDYAQTNAWLEDSLIAMEILEEVRG